MASVKASTRVRRRLATGKARANGFESRPWGGFENIIEGGGYKVKRLTVDPGHRISLQRHRRRAEHWVVVEGSPRVIVDVQHGSYLGEEDSIRKSDDYGRSGGR